MTKKTYLIGLVLVLGVALVACGDDGEQQPPPKDGRADGVAGDGHVGGDFKPQPDVFVPPGCDPACVKQAPYLCVKDTSDGGVGTCVQCLKDADCTGNPNTFGPKCNTTLNKCECSANADCATNNNGKTCETTLKRCYCTGDADCTAPLKCVGTYISTKVCKKPCASAADCGGATPVCDTAKGSCVACVTNADCSGNLNGGLCSVSTSGTASCSCKADGDCKGAWPWGTKCTTGRCGCTADGECGGSGHGPTCHVSYSKCTCKADTECTKAPYTKCNPAYSGAGYHTCQKPCNTLNNTCQYTLATGGWPTPDNDLKCDSATGACYECKKDADCSGSTTYKYCNVAKGACVACKTDADCSSSTYSKYCLVAEGKCVACKTDADCSTNTTNKYCLVSTGSCVKCKTNADCTSESLPACNASMGSCVECKASADCAKSPYGTTCDTAQNLCKCDSDALCKSGVYTWGNICDTTKSPTECVCKVNADCTGNAHGPTCYKSTSTATAGKCTCTADAQCTKAPYTKCTGPSSTASYKYCIKPCLTNADCTSTTDPACDKATGLCEECVVAADCAKEEFSKTCDKKSCVECATDANCGVSSLGNKCSGSICVCATNADCATRTVGHVCNSTSQACSCVKDTDCPTGKKCTGSYAGITICK